MKTVRLLDDVWLKPNRPQWINNVLTVGDELPVKGEVYVVKSTFMMNTTVTAYKLEGFEHLDDYSENAGWFKIERFETVDDVYTPNTLVKIGDHEFIGEEVSYVAFINFGVKSINIDLNTQHFKHD